MLWGSRTAAQRATPDLRVADVAVEVRLPTTAGAAMVEWGAEAAGRRGAAAGGRAAAPLPVGEAGGP